MEFAPYATQELTVPPGMFSDVKEQVKQAIDIVDLVGGYMQLRRQGRGYVALCPWHDDSRPSLQVNPERQSFKCWVCDIGGDIFSFIMKMEGVEFREALEMLADRAGIPLQQPDQGPRPASAPPVNDKRTLYQAMGWAEKQYHDCLLQSPEAEPARRYLQERGITAESIEQFHLGFSPTQRDWILQQAGGSPARARVLEGIGVLARPAGGGSLYDRFKGRVLFSIRDVQGRPVGLGGRVLPELGNPSPAKYVNSPDTPLFLKSHLLYGLDVARDAIRKCRTALVMEGYTDCIVAHQYGFTHAVAVLGTALGEHHVKILKRFADRIVLVLDGDEAGQRRANEVLELFVAQQVNLDIVTRPDDLDPCDFLHERGAAAFGEILEKYAVDALDHAFRNAVRGIDVEHDVHGSAGALDRLVAIVAKAPRLQADTTAADRFREEKVLQRLAAFFRVDETEVRRRMTALRRKSSTKVTAPRSAPGAGEESGPLQPEKLDACERELLELLLRQPELWPVVWEAGVADRLSGRHSRRFCETCCRLADAGTTPTFDRLMLEFDEPAVKSLLVELDEASRAKGERPGDPHALLTELLATLKRKEVERQRPAQITTLRERRLDSNQETNLLEDILQQERIRHEQERRRQGISEPTDG
jgi:DNA primase